jgi:hypothetical protein
MLPPFNGVLISSRRVADLHLVPHSRFRLIPKLVKAMKAIDENDRRIGSTDPGRSG